MKLLLFKTLNVAFLPTLIEAGLFPSVHLFVLGISSRVGVRFLIHLIFVFRVNVKISY